MTYYLSGEGEPQEAVYIEGDEGIDWEHTDGAITYVSLPFSSVSS